jgi:hypothetical protein
VSFLWNCRCALWNRTLCSFRIGGFFWYFKNLIHVPYKCLLTGDGEKTTRSHSSTLDHANATPINLNFRWSGAKLLDKHFIY